MTIYEHELGYCLKYTPDPVELPSKNLLHCNSWLLCMHLQLWKSCTYNNTIANTAMRRRAGHLQNMSTIGIFGAYTLALPSYMESSTDNTLPTAKLM